MDGLTTKSPTQLILLAKSWLSPPEMKVEGDGYQSEGYDPSQRGYVVDKIGQNTPSKLKLTFDASPSSPIDDLAVMIKQWGEGGARLTIDGNRVDWGKNDREGFVHRLQGTDLLIWMHLDLNTPLHVELTPDLR